MFERVQLKNGQVVDVNFARKSACNYCGEEIFWGQLSYGKFIPIQEDDDLGYICHVELCTKKVHNA